MAADVCGGPATGSVKLQPTLTERVDILLVSRLAPDPALLK